MTQRVECKPLDRNLPVLGTDLSGHRFVCCTRTETLNLELLRSYKTRDAGQRRYDGCYLWEAVRATTGAPLFFDPIKLRDSGVTLADGAMRENNPIYEMVREARRVWDQPTIGCILSLGTGWSDPKSLGSKKNLLHEVAQTCVDIAMNAKNRAQEFIQDEPGAALWENGAYFRFDVDQGMKGIQVEEWQEMKTMEAWTDAYLSRVEVAKAVRTSATTLARITSDLSEYFPLKSAAPLITKTPRLPKSKYRPPAILPHARRPQRRQQSPP